MSRALSSNWIGPILAGLAVAIVALVLGGLAIGLTTYWPGATSKLDGEVAALQAEIDNLTTYVGYIPEPLRVTDVEAKEPSHEITVTADNVIITGNLTVAGSIITAPPPELPISGWLAFWWTDPSFGYKHSWARFDPLTGKKIGTNIPYSPSEARQSSQFKSQFKPGANPHEIAFMLQGDRSGIGYMVRHNLVLGTYNKTVLGAAPANHYPPEIMTYDAVNQRYIAMCRISSASFRYAVVIIDPDTGVITPLTGDGGTLPPAPVNQALDMQVIGNRIYFFERWDDGPGKGRIIWFDRDTGQYVGNSFFNGVFVPYPGTFVPTVWTDSYIYMWFQSVGYDAQNARLLVVLGEVGGGYDRTFARIQGANETDLMAKMESGNYDLLLTQHQMAEQINAACWIDP